jgi:peptidyl-Lys metalloendopeptidase
MGEPLTCTLSVPRSLEVGELVELVFRLSNPTSQPLYVLNWHTPLEGHTVLTLACCRLVT